MRREGGRQSKPQGVTVIITPCVYCCGGCLCADTRLFVGGILLPHCPSNKQDKIDGLAAQHPDRFKCYYVVDKPK